MAQQDIAPWDRLPAYSSPTETIVSPAGPGVVKIVSANPRRVYLAIASPVTASTSVSTSSKMQAGQGFTLTSSVQYVAFGAGDDLPLTTAAWYTLTFGISFTIVEVTCDRGVWPKEGVDLLAGLWPRAPDIPPTQISALPGVGGTLDILDYWARLKAGIGSGRPCGVDLGPEGSGGRTPDIMPSPHPVSPQLPSEGSGGRPTGILYVPRGK